MEDMMTLFYQISLFLLLGGVIVLLGFAIAFIKTYNDFNKTMEDTKMRLEDTKAAYSEIEGKKAKVKSYYQTKFTTLFKIAGVIQILKFYKKNRHLKDTYRYNKDKIKKIIN